MIKKAKKGQSLVEYGLILALVSVIAIAALQLMGGKIQNSVSTAGNQLDKAAEGSGAAYCTSIGKTYDSATGLCQ
jgi:Flp pilus assembly pilin Flp